MTQNLEAMRKKIDKFYQIKIKIFFTVKIPYQTQSKKYK